MLEEILDMIMKTCEVNRVYPDKFVGVDGIINSQSILRFVSLGQNKVAPIRAKCVTCGDNETTTELLMDKHTFIRVDGKLYVCGSSAY